MHSSISYLIARDRAADLHREAQQTRLARAAVQARRAGKQQAGHRIPRLPAAAMRRLRVAFGTHA